MTSSGETVVPGTPKAEDVDAVALCITEVLHRSPSHQQKQCFQGVSGVRRLAEYPPAPASQFSSFLPGAQLRTAGRNP
jgi:hypothetical protein